MVENYLENSDLDSYELAQLLSETELLEDDFIIYQADYKEELLESYLMDEDLESLIENIQ